MHEEVPAGVFHAIARCRSLINAQITILIDDPQLFETAFQALDRARELALNWTLEHQNEMRSAASGLRNRGDPAGSPALIS
jgi:hypothetical protein